MDRIIHATAAEGLVKMEVLTARDAVERARVIHGCAPTACAALGRTLCAASLLGNMLKEDNGTVTIRINGGGPIGSITAVSDSKGNVRGYADRPQTDLPLRADGKLDVGGAVGKDGTITVSKDIGLKEPYIGSVELVSGEIAEDFTNYLMVSEQVASASALGVLVDTDCSVKAAGGFLVQLMPGAGDELITKLEDNIFLMDALTTVLSEDGPEELFRQVLKGLEYHIVGTDAIAYKCYCSEERVLEAVSCIGSEELKSLFADGKTIEVSCQFCERVYSIGPEKMKEYILSKKEKDIN